MPAAGQVGRPSDVPWLLVGPGWVVAIDSDTQTIVLLDPLGRRYDLGPPPAGALVDWSGDGRTVLFESQCGRCDPMATQTLVDLVTGSTQELSLPGQVRFTRPDGGALIEYRMDTGAVRRVTLDGAPDRDFPMSFPSAGATTGAVVSSPDGSQLALVTANGYEIVTSDGDPVRFLPPPAPNDQCVLEQWLPSDVLLSRCNGKFWSVPVTGAAPAVLNGATSDNVVKLFSGPDGDLAAEVGNVVAGTCSLWIGRLHPDGTLSKIDIPHASDPAYLGLIGTDHNRVLVTFAAIDGCLPQDPVTLAWFDTTTNAVTPLLTQTTGGSGIQALPFGNP
jgi:hypothetical protein